MGARINEFYLNMTKTADINFHITKSRKKDDWKLTYYGHCNGVSFDKTPRIGSLTLVFPAVPQCGRGEGESRGGRWSGEGLGWSISRPGGSIHKGAVFVPVDRGSLGEGFTF